MVSNERQGDGLHVDLTERIIASGVEVHRHLGPGLLEKVYEAALCYELDIRGVTFSRQIPVPLYYKGQLISEHRPDLIVDDAVIVEVKSVSHIESVHVAQTLTYLKVTGLKVGLILNFNVPFLVRGIKRLVL